MIINGQQDGVELATAGMDRAMIECKSFVLLFVYHSMFEESLLPCV